MYKYRANYQDKIEKLQVVKETPKQVVFINMRGREEREAKTSDWHSWTDTFNEAKQRLIDKHQGTISRHQANIDRLQSYIDTVRGLHEA